MIFSDAVLLKALEGSLTGVEPCTPSTLVAEAHRFHFDDRLSDSVFAEAAMTALGMKVFHLPFLACRYEWTQEGLGAVCLFALELGRTKRGDSCCLKAPDSG